MAVRVGKVSRLEEDLYHLVLPGVCDSGEDIDDLKDCLVAVDACTDTGLPAHKEVESLEVGDSITIYIKE